MKILLGILILMATIIALFAVLYGLGYALAWCNIRFDWSFPFKMKDGDLEFMDHEDFMGLGLMVLIALSLIAAIIVGGYLISLCLI